MGRLFFLIFSYLLYPAEVAIALNSDRDHPAIVDAQNIEIDFATGQRIYRGDVTIRQGTLHIMADEIHLFFNDDVLRQAIAHGQPAVFRQQPEGNDHQIRGQAQTIKIDRVEDVVIFSGEAKLQQHRDTITGAVIIYHTETEKMTVRGDVNMLSQTTRLSNSDTTTNSAKVMSNSSARPRIVIQSQADTAAGEPAKISSEPSILSTKIGVDSESTGEPKNHRNTTGERLESSGDLVQFHAARVIDAGTAAYSQPGTGAAFLGGLSGQMPVKVLELRNDSARVAIPSGINVWVFTSYIVQDRNGQTRIQGRGVRARRLPSTDSRILGILAHGERVRVLTTRNQWKEISLPASIAAWIPVSQLKMLAGVTPAWRSDWQVQARVPPAIGN